MLLNRDCNTEYAESIAEIDKANETNDESCGWDQIRLLLLLLLFIIIYIFLNIYFFSFIYPNKNHAPLFFFRIMGDPAVV